MFDDLQRQHSVELLARIGNAVDIAEAVINRQPAFLGVLARHGNGFGRCVDAGYRKPEPGHWLGDQPAAAADIRESQALEGDQRARVSLKAFKRVAADEIEAYGVYLVERREAALDVPPIAALRGEAIDILAVYRVAEFRQVLPALRVKGSL
jgi:hypothetical protein